MARIEKKQDGIIASLHGRHAGLLSMDGYTAKKGASPGPSATMTLDFRSGSRALVCILLLASSTYYDSLTESG